MNGGGLNSRRRTAHHGLDHDGYIRSESEERIAGGAAGMNGNSGGWGSKSLGEGDVELAHANGGFDTNIVGGGAAGAGAGAGGMGPRRGDTNSPPVWGMPLQGNGLDDKDRIVKTVHINQFSEND